jgi:hypothetical protein
LRIFRNCCFEFETYKEQLLVSDAKLFSLLIKVLIVTNLSSGKEIQEIGLEHIDEIYFTHLNQEAFLQEKETINDLIIDIFLVLTNLQDAIDLMKEKGLGKVLGKIKSRLQEDENLRDRLFVISNYLEN